ncbi:capsule assembly Wzi family protein [Sediminibacterium sp.]|uniref:capsule assembly Wzi family protein n=1 Tax=Sediminibacterium sp. TaxID=1917865 RepID=UPI0025D19384|nr:capsule assembly Wzi family protein [Sediminibacterium sp.]MBT9485714.1 hypothetical protein [Sediminibacterium sp.]
MSKQWVIGLWCLSLSFTAVGQQVSDDRLKELLRIQQLLQSSTPNYQTHSLLVNPNQVSSQIFDSLAAMPANYLFNQKSVKIRMLPLGYIQQATSILPYDINGGSMLPARGDQLLATAGLHASIGKKIQIQIAPEWVMAANKNFEGFSQQLGNRAWADRYRFWNTIDIPEQFGQGRINQLLPGQSFIKYQANKISIGLSTQNLWWGPGNKNALIMSTNAPGFLHWSVETNQPIQTNIGAFEGQIIGGELTNSGIEPPRTNSVYNGSFVYQPKPNRTRYMTGMMLSWRPKWTPNLYLGFAKASYLYSTDITNPLDYLPLQGFLGKSITNNEKNNQKASMGSLFIRYIMPKDQAELYLEYGRKEQMLTPFDFITTDEFRRAYIVGFRKLFPTKNNAHILFAAEFTQMQAQTAEFIRNPDSWYSHEYVREGYTNRGRSIGAGIGPGSNSQTFEIAWIKGLKRIGIQFERLRHHSDFYYYAFEYTSDFRRHWIDLATHLKLDWHFKNIYLSGQFGLVRSYNYKWLIIQVDPNNFFAPGNEILNVAGKLSLRYRL